MRNSSVDSACAGHWKINRITGTWPRFFRWRIQMAPPACNLVPLADLPHDRAVPDAWLGDSRAEPVTDAFVNYVRPLVGKLLEFPAPLAESLDVVSPKELSR